MKEEWRLVDMLSNAYELSNACRLRNVNTQRIIKPSYSKIKAITYQTCVCGKHKNFTLLTMFKCTWPDIEHDNLSRKEVNALRKQCKLSILPKELKRAIPKEVFCVECEKSFKPKSHNDKYCCQECRRIGQTRQQRQYYLNRRSTSTPLHEKKAKAKEMVKGALESMDIFNKLDFTPGCAGPQDPQYSPLEQRYGEMHWVIW